MRNPGVVIEDDLSMIEKKRAFCSSKFRIIHHGHQAGEKN